MYMKTLRSDSIFNHNKISGSSSLLIPNLFADFLQDQIGKFGNLRNYLTFLINQFGQTKINLHLSSKIKTTYQEKNLELVKFNFCPFDMDWLRIKILAQTKSVSITLMFVIMMGWHYSEEKKNRGIRVPIKPVNIQLSQTIRITNILKFQKKLRI